jgi:hypothetical protein
MQNLWSCASALFHVIMIALGGVKNVLPIIIFNSKEAELNNIPPPTVKHTPTPLWSSLLGPCYDSCQYSHVAFLEADLGCSPDAVTAPGIQVTSRLTT